MQGYSQLISTEWLMIHDARIHELGYLYSQLISTEWLMIHDARIHELGYLRFPRCLDISHTSI